MFNKTKKLFAHTITLISVVLFSFISTINAYAAEGPTSAEYGVVLNLSGKQRMLSQKMSKEVLLIALNEEKSENLKNLENTSALFDKTLKGLRDGDDDLGLPITSSKRILRQLDKIDVVWADLYPTVKEIISAGSASKEQVALIAKNNLPLLKQMNKAVGLYEKDAKKGGLKAAPGLASTINLAGKQRMLSQKMSKEFLLIAYGHEVEDNKLALLETYSLFETTLIGLKDGDENMGLPGTKTQLIRDQLDTVNGLWVSFKPLVVDAANYKTTEIKAAQITELAQTNLPLLKEMNKAVGMYEKESAQ